MQATEIGGQFNMAKSIPGKEEFHETIRYFNKMLVKTGVNMKMGKRVTPDDIIAQKFDIVAIATGEMFCNHGPKSFGLLSDPHFLAFCV
jgi:2,4-dienoyl-CoA reductase (NADPH2)